MNLPLLEKREILAALSGASAQNNLWRAVLSILTEQRNNALPGALGAVIQPGITRDYCAGYAAQAADTLTEFQNLWDEAQKLNRDEQSNQQPS